jgi:erythromycin esterase
VYYKDIGGDVLRKKNVLLFIAIIFLVVVGIVFMEKKEEEAATRVPEPKETVGEPIPEPEITNQDWLQWVKGNAKDIGEIKEGQMNFTFIDEIATNNRFLFLGESSHGVADYNTFKVELIKYLHKKHDFDVLAFETGIAEASASFADMKVANSETAMKNGLYPIWHTEEVLPIFDYMKENRQSENPLILTGIDMQPGGTFPEFVYNWFHKVDPKMADKVMNLEVMYRDNAFYSGELTKDNFAEDKEEFLSGYQESIDFIEKHEKELQNVYPDLLELTTITKKTFENRVIALTDYYSIYDLTSPKLMDIRDQMMADNLQWLMTTVYPDKKIIVWGHNYHIRDNNNQVESENINMAKLEPKSMFQYLPIEIKENSYNLGLYMYEGSAAYNGGYEYVVNSKHGVYEKDSLEKLLNQASGKSVFINVEGQKENAGNSWMFQPLFALQAGMEKERFILKNHYDGIVLMKEVHSPKYIE